MLVLVILQTYTSGFFFNLRLHFIPGVTKVIFCVSEGLTKSSTCWLANTLVETEAGQDTGRCIPTKLGNALANLRKWTGSLFTSGLLHNFVQVKVKEVCLSEWTLHLLINFYLSHLKNTNAKMKVCITGTIN